MNLFNTAIEYVQLFDQLSEVDGIDEQTFNDTLESISFDLETKVLETAKYSKNLSYEIDAIKKAELDLRSKRRDLEYKQSKISSLLHDILKFANISGIIGNGVVSVSLRKCPLSVKIVNESIISDVFKETKVYEHISKTEILKALKSGLHVNGVKLVKNKMNVVIK
jgi:hypothetical protein